MRITDVLSKVRHPRGERPLVVSSKEVSDEDERRQIHHSNLGISKWAEASEDETSSFATVPDMSHAASAAAYRDVVSTARLDLVSVGLDFITASLEGRSLEAEVIAGVNLPEGWAREHQFVLSLRRHLIEENEAAVPWLLRLVVLRETGQYVGYINFHEAPAEEASVEIGYEIEPDHRRRGYAEEAAVAMIRWASERGIQRIRASVRPDNEPSLAMVRKLGFTKTGEQWDERDGLELILEADARLVRGVA
jgi:[ribosomal protein S5]-alanine N-acetyltransferase